MERILEPTVDTETQYAFNQPSSKKLFPDSSVSVHTDYNYYNYESNV